MIVRPEGEIICKMAGKKFWGTGIVDPVWGEPARVSARFRHRREAVHVWVAWSPRPKCACTLLDYLSLKLLNYIDKNSLCTSYRP